MTWGRRASQLGQLRRGMLSQRLVWKYLTSIPARDAQEKSVASRLARRRTNHLETFPHFALHWIEL
jgi:hypothetical protein